MALGAGRADVMRMVIRQGMAPVLIGMAAGMIATPATSRWMASLLFGVTPTDAGILLAAPIVLLSVAAAACFLPAARASRLDPMVALRIE
jgi:ABC-type antimicrobial peptide transport system permease subunit